MPGTRNLKTSQASDRLWSPPLLWVFLSLVALGTLAAWFCFSHDWILYYGDAEARLNNARKIIDSRTPGYEQIGTVWLPFPSLLMLPLVRNMNLWRSGLAGTIPGVLCFVVAGTALFAAVRRFFGSVPAALCAAAVFALNPNLLYLQSTPMTEPIMFACLMTLVYFGALFADTKSYGAAVGVGLSVAALSLTRYEGWFLVPFVCLYVLLVGGRKRWTAAIVVSLIAGAALGYWLLHNRWYYSNALEFYNGPYSNMAINRPDYPGYHDWKKAFLYYGTAGELCVGGAAVFLGLVGLPVVVWKRAWWPLSLFLLIPLFYVLSVHGSNSPIFLPTLWPNTWYNSRYGMGLLPLVVLGIAGLVSVFPERMRRLAAVAVVIAVMIPWLTHPVPDNWITWKESQINSEARRRWTAEAAQYLASNYKFGSGIFFSWGDLTGILREAGIPLKQTLHNGNGPHALAAEIRPDLFLWEQWVIAIAGDPVSSAMMKAVRTGPAYNRVQTIQVTGGPLIEIYRRTHDYSFHQSAWREK